jgi:hypothetical protein
LAILGILFNFTVGDGDGQGVLKKLSFKKKCAKAESQTGRNGGYVLNSDEAIFVFDLFATIVWNIELVDPMWYTDSALEKIVRAALGNLWMALLVAKKESKPPLIDALESILKSEILRTMVNKKNLLDAVRNDAPLFNAICALLRICPKNLALNGEQTDAQERGKGNEKEENGGGEKDSGNKGDEENNGGKDGEKL